MAVPDLLPPRVARSAANKFMHGHIIGVTLYSKKVDATSVKALCYSAMSKFVDKIQRVSKSSTPPIGFRSAISEPKIPAMLLIAGLSGPDIKEAELAANSGVDAGLILSSGLDTKYVRQAAKAMGDIPLGILIRDVSQEKVDKLVESGCDFAVFDIRMPAIALHNEEVGKFLMVAPTLDQGLVRAINSFDVEGVFIHTGEESLVTLEHLLIYQRFSELLEKPVVIGLPSLVTNSLLKDLWQIGVDGILIPPSQPSEAFAELKKMIASLPKEAKRMRGKIGVMLPHYTEGMPMEEEEEEEEE